MHHSFKNLTLLLVYRATIHPAGRESYEAAVKIPHSNSGNDTQDNSGLKQEALIFSLLQHQNILRLVLT